MCVQVRHKCVCGVCVCVCAKWTCSPCSQDAGCDEIRGEEKRREEDRGKNMWYRGGGKGRGAMSLGEKRER